jgi:predicted RNA polymerase sigma factor
VVVRRTGDFYAAEDAVQEALLAAALRWPRDGVPAKPLGWLVQTAVRRMIDQRRSDQSRRDREGLALVQEARIGEIPAKDDTLILLFMCCHPALTPASAIALTLRAVGGLTTAQIANAFLAGEPTTAQRISRAKQTIKASGARFRLPTRTELTARVRTVLHVLYLIFNEGYASSTGLLALMLLIDARRRARINARDELVTLAEQDRTQWDQALIAEGVALLNRAIGKGAVGAYQLQAAISAVHDRAVRPEETDWPQILGLYGLLEQVTGNPIVTLNRAVAAAMVDGPAAGLTLLAAVEDRLNGHYRLDAVRAHLLEMAGDTRAAIAHYRAAASHATNLAEQRYLTTQAARLKVRVHATASRPADG